MRTQVKNRFATHAPEETLRAGALLAASLRGGDVVLLHGPLGAGKSVFARGIARGLGSTAWRGSPTYNLIHEYATDPALYHADLYRLTSAGVEDLGLEEYARVDSVLVVEWADRAAELLATLARRRLVIVNIQPAAGNARDIGVEVEDMAE